MTDDTMNVGEALRVAAKHMSYLCNTTGTDVVVAMLEAEAERVAALDRENEEIEELAKVVHHAFTKQPPGAWVSNILKEDYRNVARVLKDYFAKPRATLSYEDADQIGKAVLREVHESRYSNLSYIDRCGVVGRFVVDLVNGVIG